MMHAGCGYRAASARRHREDGAPRIVAQNVAAVAALEAATLAQLTWTDRVAGGITRLAGTTGFALFHVAWFGAWILVKVGGVPGVPRFDPFPFSLLTLVVSLEAIFLAVFVLISQNRMTRQADRRAHLDLQINLLAEQESTRTVSLLERIADHLGVPRSGVPDAEELAKPTDIHAVVTTLERSLPAD
jgi:uncharacterized membrane protein